MTWLSLCVIVLVLHIPNDVMGFGSGTWTVSSELMEACDSMQPSSSRHGAEPQSGAAPYTISVSSKNYKKGDTLTVTISGTGGATFKGFMLQARVILTATHVGTFAADTKTPLTYKYNCDNFGKEVSHINPDAKTSETFEWTPPEDDEGNIQFVYTVVQDTATFWVQLKSDKITYGRAAQMTSCSITLITSLMMLLKILVS